MEPVSSLSRRSKDVRSVWREQVRLGYDRKDCQQNDVYADTHTDDVQLTMAWSATRIYPHPLSSPEQRPWDPAILDSTQHYPPRLQRKSRCSLPQKIATKMEARHPWRVRRLCICSRGDDNTNHLVVGVSLFDKTGQDSLGPVVEVRIASAKDNGNLDYSPAWFAARHQSGSWYPTQPRQARPPLCLLQATTFRHGRVQRRKGPRFVFHAWYDKRCPWRQELAFSCCERLEQRRRRSHRRWGQPPIEDCGGFQRVVVKGGVVEAKKVVGPNSVNGKVVIPGK